MDEKGNALINKIKSLFTHKVSAKTSVKNHEKNYRLHDISYRFQAELRVCCY